MYFGLINLALSAYKPNSHVPFRLAQLGNYTLRFVSIAIWLEIV